jgi:hypothetical protein
MTAALQDSLPHTGSRRRKLWELPRQLHCPVLGVCLPLEVLRRLVGKVKEGQAFADDYEIHAGAVSECGHRNRLSELLQRELGQRHARTIQLFRFAKTTVAVSELWAGAVAKQDVAGALWAALTHPRCDAALHESLRREMHMLQHQAGANMRNDQAKLGALMQEHAMLMRELGKVQARTTHLLAEKNVAIERMTVQLMQARAEMIKRDSAAAFLRAELDELRASVPGLETRARLQERTVRMAERQSHLEMQVTELQGQLDRSAKAEQAALVEVVTQRPQEPATVAAIPIALHLKQRNVLCVGGRNGNIATYRDLIERVGGRFTHHDGGLEDRQSMLDTRLAAADIVICQTGCISHNAYWRVKDFCKRTGKRCVFVENPSAASLARGLEQVSSEACTDDVLERAGG